MENKRLLSAAQMRYVRTHEVNDFVRAAAKAQLTKNDRWWIKNVDDIFQSVPDCWLQSGCGEESCTCEYQQWKSLKKSLKEIK
jgi:murein endopeptidase